MVFSDRSMCGGDFLTTWLRIWAVIFGKPPRTKTQVPCAEVCQDQMPIYDQHVLRKPQCSVGTNIGIPTYLYMSASSKG